MRDHLTFGIDFVSNITNDLGYCNTFLGLVFAVSLQTALGIAAASFLLRFWKKHCYGSRKETISAIKRYSGKPGHAVWRGNVQKEIEKYVHYILGPTGFDSRLN